MTWRNCLCLLMQKWKETRQRRGGGGRLPWEEEKQRKNPQSPKWRGFTLTLNLLRSWVTSGPSICKERRPTAPHPVSPSPPSSLKWTNQKEEYEVSCRIHFAGSIWQWLMGDNFDLQVIFLAHIWEHAIILLISDPLTSSSLPVSLLFFFTAQKSHLFPSRLKQSFDWI